MLYASLIMVLTIDMLAEMIPLLIHFRFGCGEGAGSVILDITLPITWSNLNVDFRNIGNTFF